MAKTKIIFIGPANDRATVEKIQRMMQNNSINVSGYFKLYELPVLLKKLKLFISVDTDPLCIANAAGVLVIDKGGIGNNFKKSPPKKYLMPPLL